MIRMCLFIILTFNMITLSLFRSSHILVDCCWDTTVMGNVWDLGNLHCSHKTRSAGVAAEIEKK